LKTGGCFATIGNSLLFGRDGSNKDILAAFSSMENSVDAGMAGWFCGVCTMAEKGVENKIHSIRRTVC